MIKIKEKHITQEWQFAIQLMTPYEEDHNEQTNDLHIAFFNRSYWISIPQLIKPVKKWVDLSKEEWCTSPQKGYTESIQRDYGFSINSGTLHIRYGIQPGRWSSNDPENSDHAKCFFLPWNEQRRMYIDYLKPDGTLFERYFDKKNGAIDFDNMDRIRNSMPKIKFSFNDCDGEENIATCYIENMVYRQGTGWFKWLGYIFKPKNYRRLDITFDKETGYEKGSWKGGTMGTSENIAIGESPISAFTRYGTSMESFKNHGKKSRGFTNIKEIK